MNVSKERVIEIIEGVGVSANVKNIPSNDSLRKAGIDSLEMMNVFLAIEEQFDIKISDEEIDGLQSVDDLVQYLQRL